LRGNPVNTLSRDFERLLFYFPNAFPAYSRTPRETGARQHLEVFGDCLPCNGSAPSEASDGQGAFRGQAGDKPQARIVSERREDQRSSVEPPPSGAISAAGTKLLR